MKIVEGERYVLRDGRVTEPMVPLNPSDFEWIWETKIQGDSFPVKYTAEGKFLRSRFAAPQQEDIVARYTPEPVPATSKTEAQIQHAEVCGLLREIRDALREPLEERPKAEAREWWTVLDKHGNGPLLYDTLTEAKSKADKWDGDYPSLGPHTIAHLREVLP